VLDDSILDTRIIDYFTADVASKFTEEDKAALGILSFRNLMHDDSRVLDCPAGGPSKLALSFMSRLHVRWSAESKCKFQDVPDGAFDYGSENGYKDKIANWFAGIDAGIDTAALLA